MSGELLYLNDQSQWARLMVGSDGHSLVITGGMPSWMSRQAAPASDTAPHTIATAVVPGVATVAVAASVQSAITALENAHNDLLAKLRAAGILLT